ncbi:maleylpyruvate isomerase family mycothiol-dependent enzyme [Amorphoplanes nipponensis]|uniref:Maleylpyruvate isomerase n=1 Tax=Actinoplanes nipponensis TaxID=135950 RepID=A0A919JJC7_9ACTN|nr:maleylpyruvate isomerase family mycothiol-dependent enzyme [Actinoplanes nipponensis]GIE52079.1 maleylpyruvate isomerase [Actinoplanes nipponensis]
MVHGRDVFAPRPLLRSITTATEQLLRTAATLHDADLRQPSLLPGWSRAHVLTHLARNADAGTRMLTWARTGIETPEYPSPQARATEIEAGAGRTAEQLLADVRDSATRFAAAYEAMPEAAWTVPLRWMSGKVRPAYRAADARLTEVLVHHVDLRAGFGPGDWPAGFVRTAVTDVVGAFAAREHVPGLHLVASDTEAEYRLGAQEAPLVVRAPQAALLAWLLGRADGVTPGEPLPALPFLY